MFFDPFLGFPVERKSPKKRRCLLLGHAIWTRQCPFSATGFTTAEFTNAPVTRMMRRSAEIFNESAAGCANV